MFLGYLSKVFNLLRVIDFHLSHGRIQDRLTTCRDLVITLRESLSIWLTLGKSGHSGRLTLSVRVASEYLERAFRCVSITG